MVKGVRKRADQDEVDLNEALARYLKDLYDKIYAKLYSTK